jgi:hypothetical protein
LAKHLTQLDIEAILGTLDGWQGKLTWDSLCDAVVKHIGKRPTRQSLNSNKQIKLAFQNKKSRLKAPRGHKDTAFIGYRWSTYKAS